MSFGILAKGTALAVMAVFSVAGTKAGPKAGTANWNTHVVLAGQAHIVGNPQAKHTLTEFVSYTCSHCATFAKQGEGTLQLAFVGPGHMKREVRNIVRDPLDLTVAMLAQCGAPAKFVQNHATFMRTQDDWLPILQKSTPTQRQRWSGSDYGASRRAIATDFGFYKVMERRGYKRSDVDRCLTDDAKAKALSQSTFDDFAKYKIAGTPSFAIDGTVLPGTSSWAGLEPQLVALYRDK